MRFFPVVTLFLLLTSVPGFADSPTVELPPWSVAAGVFSPSDSIVRALGGDTQIAVEGRYAFPLRVSSPASQPSKSLLRLPVGVTFLGSRRANSENYILTVSATPTLGLNGRDPLAPGAVFAGFGAFVSGAHSGRSAVNVNGYHVSLQPGVAAEIGINLGASASILARYQAGGRAEGFVGEVGVRF